MPNRGLSVLTKRPLVPAVGVLLLSWPAIRLLVDLGYRDADTPIYRRYGELIAAGLAPYRDFALEYPPGAAAAFLPPAVVTSDFSDYTLVFEALMVGCALLALFATAASLRRLGTPPLHATVALLAVALAPLALATVALGRYDFLPVALVALWLALELGGRPRAAAVVLGLAIAAKLYPLALLPLALLWAGRRHGRREAGLGAAIALGTCGLCFLPFLILSPGGVADSLLGQLRRPLQLESHGASVLLAAHRLLGVDVSLEDSSGSLNLVGDLPDAVASFTSMVQIGLVVVVYVLFARKQPPTATHLVVASAAVVTALVATGKVFSPQFLLWLVVLVPLVPGLTGLAGGATLLLAMLMTTSWFPFRYFALSQAAGLQTALLLARNLLLLGLLVVLLRLLRRQPAPA
jgi:hypothetical protein